MQFMVYPQNNNKKENKKNPKYVRNFKQFDKVKFEEELKIIDWNTILAINQNDVNLSLDNFIRIIECLLDKHAPFVKVSNKQLKNKSKPWLTNEILNSIKVKN